MRVFIVSNLLQPLGTKALLTVEIQWKQMEQQSICIFLLLSYICEIDVPHCHPVDRTQSGGLHKKKYKTKIQNTTFGEAILFFTLFTKPGVTHPCHSIITSSTN